MRFARVSTIIFSPHNLGCLNGAQWIRLGVDGQKALRRGFYAA